MMRLGSLAAAALALAISLPAMAQSPKPSREDVKKADALFNEALEAGGKGDFDAACPKFRESQKLDPGIGTQMNLATCEEKRNKLTVALAIFEEVAKTAPDSDKRKAEAKAKAAELAAKIPQLTIKLSKNAPGTTVVKRDGEIVPAESLGKPILLEPGSTEVVAEAPGRATKTFPVELKEGDRTTLEVGPEEASAGPATSSSTSSKSVPEPPAAPGGGNTQRTVGFVLAGVGVVGLGVGAVTGVMVLGRKSTVEEECPGQRCKTQAGLDAASSGSTLSLLSTVAFGVGIAGAGVGAVLILTAKKSPPTSSQAPKARRAATFVAARPTFGGGFLSVGQSF